jgi:hypothetical protein
MTGRMRALGLAAVIALTACSGGGSSSGTPDTTGPSDTVDTVPGIISGDDCVQSASAFGAVASMAGMSVTDPSNFDLDEFERLIEEARRAVSPEIRDEFDVFSEAYLELGRLVDEIGGTEGLIDPANEAKVERVGELFSDAEIQAAGESLARYFQNACTIGG